jgi:hypothetical protein
MDGVLITGSSRMYPENADGVVESYSLALARNVCSVPARMRTCVATASGLPTI